MSVGKGLRRLALGLAGVVLAILASEALLRLVPLEELGSGWRIPKTGQRPAGRNQFETDAELGYRPVLGGPDYGESGELRNDYPRVKRPGIERVLFLGDSVTARSKIVDALRQCYGERYFEYWNAGVGGFNTIQEVGYYERYNFAIDADHVVLTFHNNDFAVTPVAFVDRDGAFSVYEPQQDVGRVAPWLLQHSQLYRHYLRWRLSRPTPGGGGTASRAAETQASLARLRDRLQHDGVRFTVVLFPILEPYGAWSEREQESRRLALAMFQALGVQFFDLLEPMEAAVVEGVELCESPGDTWHPSWSAAQRFAAFLQQRGLLGATEGVDAAPSLAGDVSSVSVLTGGTQTLNLDAGPTHAGRLYLVLGSASGTRPPSVFHLLRVPLRSDAYFELTLAHPNTWIAGSYGTLDKSGRAQARIVVPQSCASGSVLHHAYVVFRLHPLTFHAVSNAVPLELVP